MKIILIKDMEKLGGIGDEVEVKDGYARNCLIPKKFAVEATKGSLHILEQKKREKERREKQLKEECEQLAEKIQAASCTISVDVGENDKLFGAVTSEMIAESLTGEDISIDKKKIILEEPIKTLGVYQIPIKFHQDVEVKIKLWVIKE